MKKEFQIKEPCSVGRENMLEITGGSFCDLCSKKVHDLTDKTDEEIKSILKSNESVCGRIQASRLYFTEEKTKTIYNFFEFPFRKIAGGVFLAAMFSSNLNAQQKISDTLRNEVLDGLIVYAQRSDDDSDRDSYYTPVHKTINIKFSSDKSALGNYTISLLTLSKKYSSEGHYDNISIPEDNLSFQNIFVVETAPNYTHKDVEHNQFYFSVNNRRIKEHSALILNMNEAKKVDFNPKNRNTLYFLDGEEISKEEYEKNRKNKDIDSYFLSEIFAEELLGKEYDLEDGIVVSYRKND